MGQTGCVQIRAYWAEYCNSGSIVEVQCTQSWKKCQGTNVERKVESENLS